MICGEIDLSSHKEVLLGMIRQVLSGQWSVDHFRKEYYPYFLDSVPTDALSEEDEDFFAAIQEKLDWTAETLTDEERDFGWIDDAEFIQWLRTELELHNTPKQ